MAGCSSSGSSKGHIQLTWDMSIGGVTGQDCSQVGGDTVQVTSTDSANTNFVDLFNCTDYGGTTSALHSDNYDVAVDLLDSHGNTLNDATPVTNIDLRGGETRNIGNFVFDF